MPFIRKEKEIKEMNRIDGEKKVVSQMIRIYCRGQKNHAEECRECNEVEAYAHSRLDSCPFGEKKPFCSKCTVHCYTPERREQIRQVMRYAGPRMLIYSPWMAVRHWLGKSS